MNKPYTPAPLDTSKVALSSDLLELIELLAKNTHEVWAQQRLAEGWQYGIARNDERKEHPCLVPYEELPENEKEYDRGTVRKVVKVMVGLGFRIEKYEEVN